YNTMVADMFANYGDRIIPAAAISIATPKDGIELIEHAVGLGLKLMMMSGAMRRPLPADEDYPDPTHRRVFYDGYGFESPYDYDPLWRRCVELGTAMTVHTGSMGWPDRSSPTSFVFNHLGHFAQAHHLVARSMFMGGVTQRFPQMNFAFLEGGVG